MVTRLKAEDLLQRKLNEEAAAIERIYFVKTDRAVNPRTENPFKYAEGTIPILVSAPHAVRHKRRKEIKSSDEFTGSTALLLNKLTGCHVLAATKLYSGDPNFDYPCIYKDLLRQLCAQHQIRLVLDLHGAARERDFAVDLGTMWGKSLLGQSWILEQVIKAFRSQNISPISQNRFSADSQHTVTWFTATQLGIPAVQLEINKEFRVPRQNPEAYSRLLAALTEVIGGLNQALGIL
ncbi:MAG TPA: hypothetical protein VHS59_02865 [Bacillota bacterium]|nr:hypothetical protein [Bacillota bacterium]